MAGPIEQKSFSAPMALLIIDGKPIGWATGVTGSEQITNVPVKVLGSLYTQEFAPVSIDCSLSVDVIHIMDESLVKSGHYPQGNTEDVIRFKEMQIECYDEIQDKPRWIAYGCKGAGRQLPLGRGGILAVSVRFDCKRIQQVD